MHGWGPLISSISCHATKHAGKGPKGSHAEPWGLRAPHPCRPGLAGLAAVQRSHPLPNAGSAPGAAGLLPFSTLIQRDRSSYRLTPINLHCSNTQVPWPQTCFSPPSAEGVSGPAGASALTVLPSRKGALVTALSWL